MKKRNFARVLAIIIIALVAIAIVLAFVGGIMGGDLGKGLFLTGMFGFIAIPVLGWVMITVYNRVHREETIVEEMISNGTVENEKEEGETE